MQFDSATINMLIEEMWEIIYMVFLSSALSYIIGIPLGITLVVTDKEDISPVPLFNKVLGLIINPLRSVPLIIPLIMVLPITKFVVGKTTDSNATVMPLVIAASPYIGRVVESSLKEMDTGVIEATKSMGTSTWWIIVKIPLPETEPSLLVGATVSVTAILGYSVMARFTGGGGLDDIAIRYGYHRCQIDMMMVIVVLLAIIVQLIQEVAIRISRESDKRIRQEDPGSGAGERIR